MHRKALACLLLFVVIVAGCGAQETAERKEPVKIGIMLSDVGLGDQSFSDAAFQGLIKARDELDVRFDYREISETVDYEKGLVQLVEQGNDIVVGLGFMVQESLEKVAKQYPDQQFVLIDSVSEAANVVSLTFKEEEGSFLIGALAALKTKSNKIGFIGGMNVPLIHKFGAGYKQGALTVNPKVQIAEEYAEDFGSVEKGTAIARKMIQAGVDAVYPAAGLTGVGALKEAEAKGKLAFGVDSDQFFAAEKAVVSSMLKHIDKAIYLISETLVKEGKLSTKHIELGLKENGVGLAQVRVTALSEKEKGQLDSLTKDIISGKITVNSK
ncbi:BMP family protein [Paenibacillus sp. MBLB4367]|uniref:BMP family lipoprotein n=1 Tax=Paenibacillus sp. MBLB4367 TaxID=3384767 RepID=UPI00390817ED